MTLEQALTLIGEELKSSMTEDLKRNGSYNTGKLSNSINYTVQRNGTTYSLVRSMLKYGDYVDQGIGRGPGRMPPVRDIMEWIQMKRIPVPTGMTLESFSYVISKSIGKKGTSPKPKPFITPSINQVMSTKGRDLITEASTNTVILNVNNSLNNVTLKG